MNARLYDPALGRFLSPDPYVQAPDFSQSFNRYSYCLNNPLRYVDKNGEFWNLIIGGLIGGIVNWATHGCQFSWKGLGYFGVGALAGALSAGIGTGISSLLAGGSFSAGFMGTAAAKVAATSFLSGAAMGGGAGAAGGLISGMGNGLLGGQNFGQSVVSGLKDGLIGGLTGGVLGGVVGGISAIRQGRDFWDGFDYQKNLDDMIAREGINNPNSKFLVANRKNARLVNETFNSNVTKVSGNKIYISPDGSSYSEYGVNFGTQSKGNLTLISKQVIREKTIFGLADVVRHEGTHQLQILAGMTNVRSMEWGAYMTNILNPATHTTIQNTFNILVNDWGFNSSTLMETILNLYPYGPIP